MHCLYLRKLHFCGVEFVENISQSETNYVWRGALMGDEVDVLHVPLNVVITAK
jgi:hypothetical protein